MESTAAPLNPQEVVETILAKLGIPGTVASQAVAGEVRLSINTPDPARLIGKHGQTLSQLQFLTNRIVQRRDVNAPRVVLDCEGYRDRQNDDLLRKAKEAADRVRRWGDAMDLGPLNPAERRAVQQHFSTDVELEAVSEPGDEGGRKKVQIRIRQAPLIAPGQTKR